MRSLEHFAWHFIVSAGDIAASAWTRQGGQGVGNMSVVDSNEADVCWQKGELPVHTDLCGAAYHAFFWYDMLAQNC